MKYIRNMRQAMALGIGFLAVMLLCFSVWLFWLASRGISLP